MKAVGRISPISRGYRRITLTSSGRCPARPRRCSAREMALGAPICTTRSISPTSMPNSMEEVAHSTRNSPDLSCRSASSRCSRETQPWCVRAKPSPPSWLRPCAIFSQVARPSQNTSVVRARRADSYTWRKISGQTLPSGRERKSSTAASTRMSAALRISGATTVTGRGAPSCQPARHAAATDSGAMVAERPMRGSARPASAFSRSSESIRCTPRLVSISACNSSTITASTPPSSARPASVERNR